MAANPDPLATVDPPSTPSARSESSRKTKCVFCDCVMTVDGQDIYHLGERAKAFQKSDERLAKKDEEIAKLQEEIRAVKAERDALKSTIVAPARRVGQSVTRT
jgi:hypothetical protein